MTGALVNSESSEAVIGAAMTVLNTLRPGLDEKLYENALVIESRKEGTRSNSSDHTRSTITGIWSELWSPI